MNNEARELYHRMKATRSGWTSRDLEKLYVGAGFVISDTPNFRFFAHPKYKFRAVAVPPDIVLSPGYVDDAITIIGRLMQYLRE